MPDGAETAALTFFDPVDEVFGGVERGFGFWAGFNAACVGAAEFAVSSRRTALMTSPMPWAALR